jgi:hypothetical protein
MIKNHRAGVDTEYRHPFLFLMQAKGSGMIEVRDLAETKRL